MNKKTAVTFVIEKQQALDSLLINLHTLHSSLSTGLAQLLLTYTHAPDSFIWIDTHGMVRGYDCTFAFSSIDTWLAQEATHYNTWSEHALLWSAKTDALIISTHPESRTFTLIQQGVKKTDLSAGATSDALITHTNTAFTQKNSTKQGELAHDLSIHKKKSITTVQH
jgi:hypothetical protein